MTTKEIFNLCGLSANQQRELLRDMKRPDWAELAASKYGWDEKTSLGIRRWAS